MYFFLYVLELLVWGSVPAATATSRLPGSCNTIHIAVSKSLAAGTADTQEIMEHNQSSCQEVVYNC